VEKPAVKRTKVSELDGSTGTASTHDLLDDVDGQALAIVSTAHRGLLVIAEPCRSSVLGSRCARPARDSTLVSWLSWSDPDDDVNPDDDVDGERGRDHRAVALPAHAGTAHASCRAPAAAGRWSKCRRSTTATRVPRSVDSTSRADLVQRSSSDPSATARP
jgi:hypothetical protein